MNPLEKHIKNWMQKNPELINDVLQYGCISGAVSELIYYHDTIKFYLKYQKEIAALLSDLDINPYELNGWDYSDPLALGVTNQNLLSWLAFEETLRSLNDSND